ncbi:hypothetical protein Q31b_26470 [Novipirellula aureliae]|uniref:DUF3352 domain-containing protein n=1 Tax=Novipirellula aureliae TaxID=2527966 RepID=A0A5C6DX27_9BACT|nr:hypothetical protein [Novipirellula aureliae]TWU41208.1 hypothetical protein Q31b_26470 [Novipirellula aureliae]
MNPFFQSPLPICLGSLLMIMMPAQPAPAANPVSIPGAPHLLPEDTLLYARLDSADEFRETLSESSLGRMLADPKLKPFAGDIYQTLRELFAQFGDEVGLSLDELLAIPSGQVAMAMMPGNVVTESSDTAANEGAKRDESEEAIRRRIARRRREQNAIAGLFMVDAGEKVADLLSLVDRLEARLIESGYVRRTSRLEKIELVRLMPPRPGRPEIEYFQNQDVIVLGVGHETAGKALDQWLGHSDEPTLADNVNFGNAMSRCIGAESTRPQFTFYADPYHVVERVVKRGTAAVFVWPILEDLGIGKIRGIGGSTFHGGEMFESISHLHLLIDTPRDGFLGLIRPETGDIMPPDWVPADVTAYTTVHWNFEKAYENLDKILALFQGEEPLKRFVEDPLENATRLQVNEDILQNLSGRYASTTWLETPVKLNSQVTAYGFELKDAESAKSAIARFRKMKPNVLKVETVAGSVIYSFPSRRPVPDSFRQPSPGIVILGTWIVFSDSRVFLERIIRANESGTPRLATEPDFDLVVSELGGKLDGEKPFMVSFVRGADYFRQFYELAKADDSRKFLRTQGEKSSAAKQFSELLERNQLPPYEEFRQYFAPGGVFGYNEPTGIHFGSFSLKPTK